MITLGIDEVGRGCWAGPLVAGVVITQDDQLWAETPPKITDSKKMSKRQREIADDWIRKHAESYGLGWVWPTEIDTLGLTASVKLAMDRALDASEGAYDRLIVDGSINYYPENPKAQALIRADSSVFAVSAASIIAKVARDTYMAELGPAYAGYGFAKHVGYGTAAHLAALQTLGVSDIHRKSFKPIAQCLAVPNS